MHALRLLSALLLLLALQSCSFPTEPRWGALYYGVCECMGSMSCFLPSSQWGLRGAFFLWGNMENMDALYLKIAVEGGSGMRNGPKDMPPTTGGNLWWQCSAQSPGAPTQSAFLPPSAPNIPQPGIGSWVGRGGKMWSLWAPRGQG